MPSVMLFVKGKGAFRGVILATALTLLALPALHGQDAAEAPRITKIAADHGRTNPSAVQTLTIHLQVRDQAAFDKAVEDIYTPGSPTYNRFMTNEDLLVNYAPSEKDIESVKHELASHGLAVLSVGKDHLSIRVQGSISNIEDAFQTEIHDFERKGQRFYANTAPPTLTGAVGSLVHGVTGLTNLKPKAAVARPANVAAQPAGSVGGGIWGWTFINQCFTGVQSVDFISQDPSQPASETFTGNSMIGPPNDTNLGPVGNVCAWTPQEVLQLYGLDSSGLTGTGQTIVLMNTTLQSALQVDLPNFVQLTGVPAFTSTNFETLYPDGQPTGSAGFPQDTDAAFNIEWIHGIAPGAKIVFLDMPGVNFWTEYEDAIQYTLDNKLSTIFQGIEGVEELSLSASTVSGLNQVLEKAAAEGVNINVPAGDGGDLGAGSPNTGTVTFPASSPYVTSVGGTSLGIPTPTGGTAQVGWGNNGFGGILGEDVPVAWQPQFEGGTQGGASILFPKPAFQSLIAGKGRHVPDVAGPADPNTGAVETAQGWAFQGGGTTWATSVFSGIWALVAQHSGRSHGQAAPRIANIHPSLMDIVPVGSATNVTATLVQSNGTTVYTAADLAAPLYSTKQFYSALGSNPDSDQGYNFLTFGTDSSLTVTTGWDNVTGWGVPYGMEFIDAAAATR
jgi:subtilase family serine protease